MDFNKTIGSIPDGFEIALFPELGISVTGASLHQMSGKCAAWLQERGLKSIGIHIANYPEFLYLFAGAMRAGVKVVLLNALAEIGTDLPFPVFDREKVAGITGGQGNAPASFSPYVWKSGEPIVSIMTSGTSGEKKLIDKSFDNFFGARGVRPGIRFLIRLFRIRVYNCSPWYHNTGMCLLLLNLSGGLFTQITAGRFNPEKMRHNINGTLPNYIITTPTMLYRCVSCGETRLPSYIICTGEHLSESTIDLLEINGGGQLLYNSYGTTETGAVSALTYVFDSVRMSGRIVEAALRLTGFGGAVFNKKTRRPGCAGEILKKADVKISGDGEVLVRTKIMTGGSGTGTGYHNTGDIGFVENNLLFLTGRRGYVINRSGEKIVPDDIAKVLARMEGVKSVQVFGISSETHGEDICAAIESESGEKVFELSDLNGVLPNYMLPQHLLFLGSFPMTPSGKVDLSALKALALSSILFPHAADSAGPRPVEV